MTEIADNEASCWDGVDGILVINMDSHPERWEHFQREVGCHLPQGKLHRLSAVAGGELPDFGAEPWFTEKTGERARFWGGTAGCALSHRRAIQFAKDKGWRNVLILEDDVQMPRFDHAMNEMLSRALQMPGRYMLYLGYNTPRPYGRKLEAGDGVELWQIEGVLATHAYLVPESMYDLLLFLLPQPGQVWEWLSCYRAVDTFYRNYVSMRRDVRTYAVIPHLFVQGGMESCISGDTSAASEYSCEGPPLPLDSLPGVCHRLGYPLRWIKIRLNSLRTRHRARVGGLPGKRRR